MSGKSKFFTLIISPDNPNKIKQFRITQNQIYLGFFALFILALALTFGSLHYAGAINKLVNYNEILTRENHLQQENLEYKEQTRQLAEKITHIEMMAKNISRLTGIDFDNPQSATGGIGGFSSKTWLKDSLNAKNLEFLQKLNEQTGTVGHKVQRLKDAVFAQNLFLSSLPTGWPVRGYVGSSFGNRRDPVNNLREFHKGVDISAPYGAKVVAPADGLVLFAGAQRGYGYIIVVAHKYGITTRYAHLSSYIVKPGQRVKKNEVIGYIGSTGHATGPHLHYEVRLNNKPLNPIRFLGSTSNL